MRLKSVFAMLVICISCLCIAITVAGDRVTADPKTAASPAAVPLVDTSKPETWRATVTEAQANLTQTARALITVAQDEKRSRQDRYQAIQLLGRIGNKESLDFLVANITLNLQPPRIVGSDEDQAMGDPAQSALYKGGWNSAQAILDSLNQPKSRAELGAMAVVLYAMFKIDMAKAVVGYELTRITHLEKANDNQLTPRQSTRKSNLLMIKSFLEKI